MRQVYKKIEYAGYRFATSKSQKFTKHDNSHLRLDYYEHAVRYGAPEKTRAYAQIRRLFVHEMYPGGPSKVVVNGRWFEGMGRCEVSGTALVRHNRNSGFNRPGQPRFAFIDTCYQVPVAIWPYDPIDKLPDNDPRKRYFHVIDRNQEQE